MTDDTIAAVRRFSRFYTKQLGILGEGLLDSRYTLTEVRVMYEIAHGKHVSASDLMEQLRLDRGYLSRILKRFERTGLIRRHVSASDKRRWFLELTAKGEREFRPLDVRQDEAVARLVEHLTKSERRRLVQALDHAAAALGAPPPDLRLRLRSPRPAELSYVGSRFAELFFDEYGYDQRFEALVAAIVADYLKRPSGDRQNCWIAVRGSQIVGSVLLMRKSASTAQLRMLFVEQGERGRGLGGRLTDECIQFARRHGFRKLSLWTQNEMEHARAIYARRGFTLVSEQRHRDFTRREIIAENWELTL